MSMTLLQSAISSLDWDIRYAPITHQDAADSQANEAQEKNSQPSCHACEAGVLEQGGGGPRDVVLIINQSPQDARGEGLFRDGIRSRAGKVAAAEEDWLTRERGKAVFHQLCQSLLAIDALCPETGKVGN